MATTRKKKFSKKKSILKNFNNEEYTHDHIIQIIESLNDGFFSLDKDLVVTYFNKKAEELLGRSRDEVLGHRLFDTFPEAKGSIFEKNYKLAIKKKMFISFITHFEIEPYKNWFEVRVHPFKNGIAVNFQVITDRMRVEAHLEESEAKYRQMFETMSEGVVYQDKDGLITSANYAAQSILGLSLAQMQGRTSMDPKWKSTREDGSDFPGEQHPSMVALKTGKKVINQIMGVYNPQKKSTNWIKINATPLFKEGDKKPYQVFTTFEDITKSKEAKDKNKEIQKQLQKLSFVASKSHSAIIITDKNGYIEWINEGFTDITGYSFEEVKGKRPASFLNGKNTDQNTIGYMRKNLKNNRGVIVELLNYDKWGREIWLLVEVQPVFDTRSKVINYVAIETDITEHKKFEMQTQQIAKDWETTFNSTAEMISIQDAGHKILRANKAFADAIGKGPEELIGIPCYKIVHNTSEPPDYCMLGNCISNVEPGTMEIEHEKLGHIEVAFYPVVDESGKTDRSIHIIRDINQRKKAEKEREEMQKQMAQTSKLASIGELAAGVGHEINNPLAVINGYINLIGRYLYENNLTNKDILEAIKSQKASVERISNIVNGLRTFAHSDDDKQEVIDINKVINAILDFLKIIYEKENIRIIKDFSKNNLVTTCQQGKFHQMVINLLNNARDATKDKKDRLITISTKKENDKAVLLFKDNGCGISKRNIDRIFDTFYTTKEVGEGTGLGLSIVRNIVNALNGTIEIESQEGIGSIFLVKIPLRKKFYKGEKKDEQITDETQFSGKVLIVDDEKELRRILKFMLIELGFEVDEAVDGVDGLDKSANGDYDYVITDLKMPKMSGEEMIRKMRLNSCFKGKIFVISGTVDKDLSAIDVDGILNKPFDEEVLKSLLVKK